MSNPLFRKKDIKEMIAFSATKSGLRKELGTLDLTLLGIGAIIGTGIFVLTGTGAKTAGPGLMISFVIAAMACLFAALAYAEFASTVPVAGSVYTYTYATLGEFLAFIIGWDLILEYLLAVASVSAGWSGYFQSFIGGFGWHLPTILTAAPGTSKVHTIIDLPAVLIVLVITFLISMGIKSTKRINNIMVFVKLLVVLLFIAVAVGYVKPGNWHPYTPFGFSGVFKAAAVVFFAFIGFDAVSSAAEETRNPKKDLPRGIILSLLICTVLYVAVSAIMTGVLPYSNFTDNVSHPVSLVLQFVHQDWAAGFVDVGAILGMTTVMLVMLFGQTRVTFAMSRDGLVPKFMSKVNPKTKTPFGATWLLGIIAAVAGGLVPLAELSNLVNIGTLSAFILVSIAVIILRKTKPNLERAFKCPFVPVVPILAILFCGFLIYQLGTVTMLRFLIWLAIGLVIYFVYSMRNSKLNKNQSNQQNHTM